MKKIILILFTCFLFAGCSIISKEESNLITTSYGSYQIPSTWTKSNKFSTRSKYFYVNKKDNYKKKPNNISVEMGTNRYSIDNHVMFRQAIVRQLAIQSPNLNIYANGSTTKQGYILYTFIIQDDQSNSKNVTKQYYIVGDYKYVLVHETIWDGNSADSDETAKYIIDSFKWKE